MGTALEEFDDALAPLTQTPETLVQSVLQLDTERLIELTEKCYLALPRPKRHPPTIFDFIANSSLSGYGFPCSNPECRQNKILELSIFSALYANCVFIRDPFEPLIGCGPSKIDDDHRLEFVNSLMTVYALEPLIEQGLISFAKSAVSLCTHITRR